MQPLCSGLKGNAIQKLRLGIYCSRSPQPAHKSGPGMTESRAGDTRSSPLGVNTHQKKRPKMETSKKASDIFCQFQYRRSGINVKNARGNFSRRMGILYIRSRIEGDRGRGRRRGQDNYGMRIPTRSPRYLENNFKTIIVMRFNCYCFYCCWCCCC